MVVVLVDGPTTPDPKLGAVWLVNGTIPVGLFFSGRARLTTARDRRPGCPIALNEGIVRTVPSCGPCGRPDCAVVTITPSS